MAKHTLQELKQWQQYPLSMKVALTKQRIRDWVREYGTDGVYVSFSGGKDSTVLLHIVRELYPEVEGVFVDTGLEYPEIREFVKTFDNITWLRPKKTFKQVIEDYGYPFISKEVSNVVYECQRKKNLNEEIPSYRYKKLNGELTDKNGNPSQYNIPQWKFLLDSPWIFSHRCCDIMKKAPAHSFNKKTGKNPITAQMASESRLRTQKWIQSGCNAFDAKIPTSNPMSFWTEQDVLQYIKQNKLKIASVYGDIVYTDDEGFEYDNEVFNSSMQLKTTGCKRTGCMFCGYGCHLNNDQRFVLMKQTHPKQYDYIMRPREEGGLDYKNIIDWLNENGHLNIKY